VNGKIASLELERVTLRSGLSVWLFSSDSVALIPQLAQMASDSPVERHLPAVLVSLKLIDTPAWRWIALGLLAAALAPLSRLVVRLVLLLAEPMVKRVAPYLDRRALQLLDGPLRLLLSVAVFRMGMAWIAPSALLRLYLERCLTLAFFAGLAWLCVAIVDLVVGRFRLALEAKRETFSYSVLPLASRVIKLTILVMMIAAVLGDWGYNTTTILAGLGVGGLAIALAAQKTIENFFGGVAVISDRPVFVGDFCRFGDRVGTVEDIGLRSTRLRTPDRTLITVPNAQFSSMTLESFSKRDKMLFHLTLNLRRDTTPEQVRSLLTSITTVLTQHPKLETGQIPVRFIGVGTYSLDLEVDAYVKTRADDEFLQIRQELLLHILDAIEGSGTALALPTQASVNYSLANALNANGAPAQEVTR
jgi:MscS family membrane protein